MNEVILHVLNKDTWWNGYVALYISSNVAFNVSSRVAFNVSSSDAFNVSSNVPIYISSTDASNDPINDLIIIQNLRIIHTLKKCSKYYLKIREIIYTF